MGFTSNWMLVHGRAPEQIWAGLGVRPSGVRTNTPQGRLVGTRRADGAYLLVEDNAEEPVEETWDLAELSGGGEVIAVGEVDGSGGAELALWRDGHKIWGLTADCDKLVVWGEVPADVLTAVEHHGRPYPDDEGERTDYFSGVLGLATAVTGYQCGSGVVGIAAEPFDILETAGVADVLTGFPTALADALADSGFRPSRSLDGRQTWFTADTPVPGLSAGLAVSLDRSGGGGVRVGGAVCVLSSAAADVLTALPENADLPRTRWHPEYGEIDWCDFDHPDSDPAYRRTATLWCAEDIDDGVRWVSRNLDGPMATWLAGYSTLADVVSRAKRTHNRWGTESVDTDQVRATIAFTAAHGHPEAADLMRWYLPRAGRGQSDTPERVLAFDAVLRARFPDYARAMSS